MYNLDFDPMADYNNRSNFDHRQLQNYKLDFRAQMARIGRRSSTRYYWQRIQRMIFHAGRRIFENSIH